MPRRDDSRRLRDALRRLLVAHGALDDQRRPCGAPLSQAHAWALLELRLGAMSVGDLAERLNIDRTNVSRLCVKMEKLGELDRVTDPEDRRARILQLTVEGQRVAANIDRSSSAHFREVVSTIDFDRDALFGALDALSCALENRRAKE